MGQNPPVAGDRRVLLPLISIVQSLNPTGLSKQAITNADHRLIELGLLESDRVVVKPPSGWFQQKRPDTIETLKTRHWRHHYTHWELMVRDPKTAQGRMTHLQSAAISFLWHCRNTDFEPRNGWSVAYLAAVLRCKWETARDALLVLEHLGMLRHELSQEGGLRLWLNKPTEDHLALFQPADHPKIFHPSSCGCSIGIAEAPSPVIPKVSSGECCQYTFDNVLRKVQAITKYEGEEAEDLAWKLLEKESDLEQLFLNFYNLRLSLNKRRLRLEKMVLEEEDVAKDTAAGNDEFWLGTVVTIHNSRESVVSG